MAPLLPLLSLASCLSMASTALARLHDGRLHANQPPVPAMPKVAVPWDGPVTDTNGTTIPPYNTTYYFDQLIDHADPSKGTFKQRYWHTWQDYEKGGPIIIMTPGETNADGYDGYLLNVTINGQIAQQQKGATIVIEHRFFGESNPLPDLSVASLKYLTLNQSVADLEYFAKNVKLPMPGGDKVAPGLAPWILVGGSYSGALTAWTMTSTEDVFFAGYASSAVVEAKVDYWAYFEPIRENMPQNCSADVQAVIAHFDEVFTGTNQTAINALKDQFGLNVSHLDDAAGALRNNLWDWQDLQPDSGPGGAFFVFCDALEVKNGKSAPAAGWGLDHALTAWGSFYKNTYLPSICSGQTIEDCLGTYDTSQSYWTDTSVNNAGRSWMWFVCNEFGFLQESAPVGKPTLVSRLIQPIYDERQCQQMFSAAFSSPPVPRANVTNSVYHGWDVKVDRLFFANGQRDPWRDVTVSADNRTVASTSSQPIAVGDGYHCSDLSTAAGVVDKTVLAVQTKALASMKTWLKTWKPSNASSSAQPAAGQFTPPTGASTTPKSQNQPLVIAGSGHQLKPVNAWFRSFGAFGQ